MTINSKHKGKTGELEASHELARLLHCDACRGVQYQGGEDSPDVRTSVPGLHFEVKRTESLRLYFAVEQAERDSGGSVPVVLHRASRKPWLAIVPLERLPELCVKVFHQLASEGECHE